MLSRGQPPGVFAKPLNQTGPPGGDHIAYAGQAQENAVSNPVRRIAFRMAVGLVFILFSNIHQLLTYVLHVNLYLMYIFSVPTLLGVALAGGVQRTLRGRPAIYWTIFVVLLIVGVPFSSWRGGSVGLLVPYLKTVFPMLFVIAGLTLTWRECRVMMWAIALGGAVIMSAANLFRDTAAERLGRLQIEFGTIANSNDYAVHLLFVLPFAIWVALGAKSKALKLVAWGVVCFGAVLVLRTASRGALIGLSTGVLYWLFRGTMRQKMVLLIAGPVAAVALIAFVPQSALVRIVAFSTGAENPSEDARTSSEMRQYLLKQSIVYTLQNPIFGVGMAQFGEYEAERNAIIGTHGLGHDTHNSYTQISVECGMPALVFYVAGILSAFLMTNRVYRQACTRPDCEDIRIATFCIMLSMTMYCAGILFVNFGYFFYLPLMCSLAIAVSNAASTEFSRPPSVTAERQLHFAPYQRREPDNNRGRSGRVAAPGAGQVSAGVIRTRRPYGEV
jgi:O-antigen ligase